MMWDTEIGQYTGLFYDTASYICGIPLGMIVNLSLAIQEL
jgi:hypothetical protein